MLLRPGCHGQDLSQSVCAMLGKLDCHLHRIDDPAEDDFPSCPAGISLEQFRDRGQFLSAGAVVSFQGTKDLVQGMEQDASQVGELLLGALAHSNEIINKDNEVAQQPFLEVTIRSGVVQVGCRD